MRILVDTNILGRVAQPSHALHSATTITLDALTSAGHELRLVPQVIYEFWVIATRPISDNGLGFSIDDTKDRLRRFKVLFPPLRDERGILEPWERLVIDHSVMGKPSHDARLVAAMRRHGLTHILTFNVGDFKRYPIVEILDPRQIANL